MFPLAARLASVALGAALLLAQSTARQRNRLPVIHFQNPPVWNLDGGVPFETDGEAAPGICFRLTGWMKHPDFFQGLRRRETADGTVFKRKAQVVTRFPDQINLEFSIFDFPCDPAHAGPGPRSYLTRDAMRSLKLSLYWKHDLAMRPVAGVKEAQFSVVPRIPEIERKENNLPERLVWSYVLTVDSAGVPLTDSLVLVIKTPGDAIAARVAARL